MAPWRDRLAEQQLLLVLDDAASSDQVRPLLPRAGKSRARIMTLACQQLLNSAEVRPMAISFQLVIDCTDPDRLSRFWAAALRYELEPPPAGFATWDEYWRDVGVPEEDLGVGADCIIDPGGAGPRIWFQVVPEPKTVKNRLHLDICASGGRTVPIATRRQRIDAEARRLTGLGATMVRVLQEEGLDHYGVAMKDPEGNEFDIN